MAALYSFRSSKAVLFLQGCIVVWKLTVSLCNGHMHSMNPIPHLSLSIGCQVIHFCHIHHFNSIAGQRRPNVTWWQNSHSVVSFLQASLCLQNLQNLEKVLYFTCWPVPRHRHGTASCAFSLTVTFIKLWKALMLLMIFINKVLKKNYRWDECGSPDSREQLSGTSGWSGIPGLLL